MSEPARSTVVARVAILSAIPGTLALGAAIALAAPADAPDRIGAGSALYAAHCASCHGEQMEGGQAPALTGTDFAQRWDADGTALRTYISASMPPGLPGRLPATAYTAITRFLLDAHARGVAGDQAGTEPAQVPQAHTFGHALPRAIQGAAPTTPAASSPHPSPRRPYRPVTDAMLMRPPAGDWLMWRGTLDNQGYSSLAQIDRTTVAHLELAWAWPMAEGGQQQTAPLVHDGIMFLSSSQNVVEALDARSGELLWTYRHPLPRVADGATYQRLQAIRQKNSIALYDDLVILATVDAQLVALHAQTGQIRWQRQVLDPSKGYGYTVGPIVFRGRIISGISGCSIAGTAGGCYIMAHSAKDGTELWRFNTLDDPANPEQQSSWGDVPPAARWGAALWATGSYDPATDTTFWGTGSAGPYTALIRGSGEGDALYTNSTLAIDAATGKRRWSVSHLPGDDWDLDSAFERILVDLPGQNDGQRLIVSVTGKNGIATAYDRDTGRFRWSKDTIYQNVVTRIDPDTGAVHVNRALRPAALGQEVFVCPSVSGGKLWQAAAYSPLTHALYVPLTESCNTLAATETRFTAGNYVGAVKTGPRVLPPGINDAGLIDAIGIDGERIWAYRQRPILTSSLLATGGGLLFGGDASRHVMALDQRNGRVLWKMPLNAPIGGYPMTYSVNGVQYLAVPTGYNMQAASGAGLSPEVSLPNGQGNSLFVFRVRR